MSAGQQAPLFDDAPVPGLRYEPHAIGAAEERALAAHIASLDLQPFEFQRWQGKRRVAYFGYRYDFTDARLEPAPPLPAFLESLRDRAARFADLKPEDLPHALVAAYGPGAGIGWHRDRPVFDRVIGFSLLSSCTLRFRRRREGRFERAHVPLAPGSAYLLTGAARFDWEHSIAPMKTLRYSVTFRSMKK